MRGRSLLKGGVYNQRIMCMAVILRSVDPRLLALPDGPRRIFTAQADIACAKGHAP